MNIFLIQFLKDFKANFSNFSAYIVIGAYYILSLFFAIYVGELFLVEESVMDAYFAMQPFVLSFIIPAITMRSWADEIKTGTIEILLTQPIGYRSLVLAKFLASYAFFILLVLTSFILLVFTYKFSIIDIKEVSYSYLGLLLTGAYFCSIGNTISIFNRNTIISYAISIFILFIITQFKYTSLENINLSMLNFEDNYVSFFSGILHLENIFYFLIGTILFLWLNLVVLEYKKNPTKHNKYYLHGFILMSLLFFVFALVSFSLNIDKYVDITSDNRYTLSTKTNNILNKINKRIDITLYEAFVKRKDANSKYGVFAEYIESILRLIEKESDGAIKSNVVLVEPFSQLERNLIKNGASVEIDEYSNKSYMVMEFTDNEGNHHIINGFNRRKSNYIETDIIRIINAFGNEKKKIGVYAQSSFFDNAKAFKNAIDEFYEVTYFENNPNYIPDSYDAFIVLNLFDVSAELMITLEQYVLNGGHLIMFGEKSLLSQKSGKPWIKFLNNFGITVKNSTNLTSSIDGQEYSFGPSYITDEKIKGNIRSVIVNDVGELDVFQSNDFTTSVLLKFNDKPIAISSLGKFPSNYIEIALENSFILPTSKKDGEFIFIYDNDLIKDYLFVEREKDDSDFYETLYISDNMLFVLRLLDYATKNNKESSLEYRFFSGRADSIGNAILKNVKQSNEKKREELVNILNEYTQKKNKFFETLNSTGFASVKNIGDINSIERVLEETTDEINKLDRQISDEYNGIIIVFTLYLMLLSPLIILIALFIITAIYSLIKKKKIRRLMSDAKTL